MREFVQFLFLRLKGVWILQTGCFFGKLPKGEGGVISDPKNYIADFFGFKTVYFGRKFWKKCPKRGGGGGVISNPKNFIANLRKLTHIYELSQKKAQCNFQKWGGGGGGQRPFGSFPKKHPVWRIQSPLRLVGWFPNFFGNKM